MGCLWDVLGCSGCLGCTGMFQVKQVLSGYIWGRKDDLRTLEGGMKQEPMSTSVE